MMSLSPTSVSNHTRTYNSMFGIQIFQLRSKCGEPTSSMNFGSAGWSSFLTNICRPSFTSRSARVSSKLWGEIRGLLARWEETFFQERSVGASRAISSVALLAKTLRSSFNPLRVGLEPNEGANSKVHDCFSAPLNYNSESILNRET